MIDLQWPWLLLLLPLPLLLNRFWKPKLSQATDAIALPSALDECLTSINKPTALMPNKDLILPWLCWIALLLAIAQPSRPGDSVVQPVSGRAMSLVIDLSGSMERKDFDIDGEAVTRLNLVKHIAGQFIKQRSGDRLSLVLFGKEAFIASPLTFDLTALASTLDSAGIGMAGRSTAIGDALGLALQSLRGDPAPSKAIVLLSDGTNNSGSVEPESAATLAASMNIRVHTIALGSERGADGAFQTSPSADLDEETLKQIAQSSGGQFFRASTSEDLSQVYARIDQLETAEVESPPIILKTDLRWAPLMALLLFLLSYSALRRWSQ